MPRTRAAAELRVIWEALAGITVWVADLRLAATGTRLAPTQTKD